MENKKEEQMIYIKDLIFCVLRRWRIVLAIVLAAAILLGGAQGITRLSNRDAQAPESQQAAWEQYESDKAAKEYTLHTAQSNLQFCEAYMKEAPLMQLDPYGYYLARLVIYVQTDYQILPGMSYQNPDRTEQIVSAYERVCYSASTVAKLAEKLETKTQYIKELVTTTKPDSATLCVSMMAATQQEAEAMQVVMQEQIEQAYEQVAKTVSSHTVIVAEQSVSAEADAAPAELQKKAMTRLSGLKTEIANAEADLAKLVPPAKSQSASVKDVIVKAVIGGVLGAFLVVAALWVMHISSDKVYAARNLRNRTGVKVIGTVGCEKKCAVDRLWYRLEGRSLYGLAATPVAADICCRSKDAKYVLITGSGETAEREALVQTITAAMPGVRVEDRGSLLKNAEALQALTDCDAVVLVERCGVSRYSAVDKQLDIVRDYGANLLGCVLMEN